MQPPDLSCREDSIHIVRAIKGLCAGLGMTTTAEGVENIEQFDKISAEGCTEVQGFLFSPPRPASEVPAILERVGAMCLPTADIHLQTAKPKVEPARDCLAIGTA